MSWARRVANLHRGLCLLIGIMGIFEKHLETLDESHVCSLTHNKVNGITRREKT